MIELRPTEESDATAVVELLRMADDARVVSEASVQDAIARYYSQSREIELARVLAATLAAEKSALTGDSPAAVEANAAEKIRGALDSRVGPRVQRAAGIADQRGGALRLERR